GLLGPAHSMNHTDGSCSEHPAHLKPDEVDAAWKIFCLKSDLVSPRSADSVLYGVHPAPQQIEDFKHYLGLSIEFVRKGRLPAEWIGEIGMEHHRGRRHMLLIDLRSRGVRVTDSEVVE